MAEIRIEVDTAGANNRLIALEIILRDALRRAEHKGAEKIKDRAQELLSVAKHPPHTRTPSPPGAPPGEITGVLKDSIMVADDGDGSRVGPTDLASSVNGPYGRFLELGGVHEGNMKWFEDGVWHEATVLKKFPRPYMRPARDESLAEIHDIAVREIRDAIRTALE